ncbi:hypothetical protein Csa_018517 [Cucumis sativus]|uniref:Uncharacterized protein n=1 Tax=Cucumis sativus TaxID=3659 RepID=A0A0A0KML1_CUCSA|nr:hypothetical protein Csa_018517 [Cucumis sativus]
MLQVHYSSSSSSHHTKLTLETLANVKVFPGVASVRQSSGEASSPFIFHHRPSSQESGLRPCHREAADASLPRSSTPPSAAQRRCLLHA